MKNTHATIERYKRRSIELLETIDEKAIGAAVGALREAYEAGATIFVAGNGGSAANANHFAADFGKNAVPDELTKVRVLSLCTNVPAITAYGNDIGFESIYREQLAMFMKPGDILIAYSVSGNSPDIIEAVQWANGHGAKVIGLTGFSGGTLRTLCDVSVHTESETYESVEDMHSVCSHMFTTCFKDLYGRQ